MSPTPAGKVPAHPPFAHVAFGAFVTAAVCDTISVTRIAGDDSRFLYMAGTYALMFAATVLVVAVVSGFFDRARNTGAGGKDRQTANVHAIVMSIAGVLSVVELMLRPVGGADHKGPIPTLTYVFTVVVIALIAAGGRIGGILVYRLGAGSPARR